MNTDSIHRAPDALVRGLTLSVTLALLLLSSACRSGNVPLPTPVNPVQPGFATGAGPNSIVASGALTYVANSLDNTVTAHNAAGAVVATASLPQFAGPAYMTVVGSQLYVVRNGDNAVSAHALDTLAADGPSFTLSDPDAMFIGPGRPATDGRFVFVPRAQILTFSPTTYGPALLSTLDSQEVHAERVTELSGRNAAAAVYVDRADLGARLYVVSAGELHFDAEFNPSITTDSFVEVFSVAGDGELALVGALNLGPVGAASLAVRSSGAPHGYVGNLLSGDVYKLDLAALSVLRGAANPIRLTETFTYASSLALLESRELLLATSFNTDELFVVDTTTDTVTPAPYTAPFSLNATPDMLAGAADMALRSTTPPSVYVLNALANSTVVVTLQQ